MSKTTLFVVVLLFCIGVGIYFYRETLVGCIQKPETILPIITNTLGTIWLRIKDYLAIIGTLGSLVGGTLIALISKFHRSQEQQTQQIQQNLETANTQLTSTVTQLNQTKTELETKVLDQKDQIIGLQDKIMVAQEDAKKSGKKILDLQTQFNDQYATLNSKLKTAEKTLEEYKKRYGPTPYVE